MSRNRRSKRIVPMWLGKEFLWRRLIPLPGRLKSFHWWRAWKGDLVITKAGIVDGARLWRRRAAQLRCALCRVGVAMVTHRAALPASGDQGIHNRSCCSKPASIIFPRSNCWCGASVTRILGRRRSSPLLRRGGARLCSATAATSTDSQGVSKEDITVHSH